MTTRTTTPTVKKNTRKANTCKATNCRKQATVKYCSTACRVATHRKADKKKSPRVVKTAIDYMDGSFWTKLCNHLGRAGTVQASPYNAGEYLALSKLDKQCAAFNGDAGRVYELSHILPASKGGFFNLANLVIAPTSMNRAHGSTHFGFGEGADMTEADPRFLITPTTPHETIKQLLIELHGEAFMLKEAKAVKPVKSTRKADLTQVLMMFNPCNDTHADLLKSVEFINGLTGRQMKQALEIIKGESTMPIYFAPAAPLADVLASELGRMTKYRPEFATIADSLTAALATQKHAPQSLFTSEHGKTLFNLLHGKTLVQSTIEKLILENTLVFRVRYGTGFDFHTIEEHQGFWMQDHAGRVMLTSKWEVAQAATCQESPF
ncbi:hypothetical protein IQK56_14435 [Pseudomonas sp. MAFF 301449]|uniref:HNH endonuclease n=1 Tax=Pseudomonas cyclaminis TaxID=2781239 RepID=A0ABR9SSY1_9PSED|nr:hypothetical protein [Pseudomonas cyclaminis]MBE8592032.1 hypothetical protein [Pseudomonas cyclaminis]